MKRVMPLLLVLALLLTVLPMAAFADTGTGPQEESSEGYPSDAEGLPLGPTDPDGDGGEEEPAPARENPVDTAPPDPQVEAATGRQATRLRAGLPTVEPENEINLTNLQSTAEDQWSSDGHKVELKGPGPFHISGTGGTSTCIVVDYLGGKPVVVILNEVNLTIALVLPFDCGEAEVVMWLEGDSALSPGPGEMGQAALRCAEGATLTIRGNGTLTATGAANGAGIGGNDGESAGTITITGDAQVTAKGGGGADIGSGYGGSHGGTLEVTGGTLTLKDSGTDADATFKNCVVDGPGAGIHAGTYDSDGFLTANLIKISQLSPGATGPGWVYDAGNSRVTIKTSGSYRIVGGGTTPNGVKVDDGLTLTVTLQDVVMEVTSNRIAFDIGDNTTVKMMLVGENDIKYTDGYRTTALIHVPENAALTIDGEGKLTVATGGYAAGIGGGNNETFGIITIAGGTVDASTRDVGAAIGGGLNSSGGTIKIEGGTVIATTSADGAAIGSGRDGFVDSITILDGNIHATTVSSGAAIGSGRDGSVGTIAIEGGNIIATSSTYGAAIGGGRNSDGGSIKIEGGTVNVTPSGGAGIGGGRDGSGGSITISGGTVIATANPTSYGAHIGGGWGGNGGDVTITGGHITANYIGRGSGNTGSTGSVKITGGSLVINRTVGDKAPGGAMSATFTDGTADVFPLPLTVSRDDAAVGGLSLAVGPYKAETDGNGRATIWLRAGDHTLAQGNPSLWRGSVDITVEAVYNNPTVAWTLYGLLTFVDATLPAATVGKDYSHSFAATGGSGSGYTYTLASGTLPGGLTLDNGVLTGTPTETGNFPFSVQVKDSAGQTATAAFDLRVSDAPPTTFAIAVNRGTATVGGATVTEAQQGVTVTITADAAPAGQVFDKWVVNTGALTLADAEASTTTFAMPGEAVRITATYKADSGGGNSGDTTRRRPSSSDSEASWTPATVTFTGVPTGAINVGDPFTVTPNYDDQTGSAGWDYDSSFFSATFNSPATFTALREGTSTITYTTTGGVTSSFTVTVGAGDGAADPAAPAPEGAAAEGTGDEDAYAKMIPATGACA